MHAAAAVLQEYIYALDVTPFCMWSSWNVLCCSCVSYMALKLLYTVCLLLQLDMHYIYFGLQHLPSILVE